MKIAGSHTVYSPSINQPDTSNTKGGNSLPPSETEQASRANTVDMNNLGLNELNALIQSTGDDRLLFRIPHNTFKLVNGELQGSQSSNFLSQIEQEIAFEQSQGKDTSELEQFMEILKGYQGYPLQPSIDVKA